MQHQILINVIIFVAYVLNLPLNTQRSHSRSQRAGKWSLILAHDRRPIYRAPTYIAVPLLGPHQPRYIRLTLYHGCWCQAYTVSWLLMSWLLTSPGHQQPWYWLCRRGRFLSYLRKDFNYVRHINVEKWHEMWIYVYVPSEKFST